MLFVIFHTNKMSFATALLFGIYFRREKNSNKNKSNIGVEMFHIKSNTSICPDAVAHKHIANIHTDTYDGNRNTNL